MAKKRDNSHLCFCVKSRPHDKTLHDRRVLPKLGEPNGIAFVGMAPGQDEAIQFEYFAGAAGRFLKNAARFASLPLSKITYLNAAQYWPKKHNYKSLSAERREEGKKELFRQLEELRPKIVVPLGSEALEAVTGLTGITKWRGSLLSGTVGSHTFTVIPTIHPSGVLRSWDFNVLFKHDLDKVLKAWNDDESILPAKRRLVIPTEPKYKEYCEKILNAAREGEVIAADIETTGGRLACVGFSYDPAWAISVAGEDRDVWETVLKSGAPIVWCNAMFDTTYLIARYGVEQTGPLHDIQFMWHTIAPELACSKIVGKSLAVLTSLYTNDVYYKDDGKEWRKVRDWDTYYRYNARDAAVTIEIAQKLLARLETHEEFKSTYQFEIDLIEPYRDATIRGVRLNVDVMKKLAKETKDKIDKAEARLFELAGYEFNPRAWQQVLKVAKEVFDLKLPNTQSPTMLRVKDDLDPSSPSHEFLGLMVEHRELQKAYGTYYTFQYDKDGRVRTNWIIPGTETGRMANSTSIIFGRGANLMTIPRPARKFFIADEGFRMVYADISQAEARIVAYLSGCQRLIDALENDEYDGYKLVASWMYGKPPSEITDDERYIAKQCVLGLLYGMGPKTWMRDVNYDKGYKYMTLKEATRLYDLFFETFPEVKQWHAAIEAELNEFPVLRTLPPVVRSRVFRRRMGRWDGHTIREAYDYIPQGTVPGLVNTAVLKIFRERGRDVQLLAQVHDAWLGQVREGEDLEENLKYIHECLTQPLDVKDIFGNFRKLIMPVDIKVGSNWMEVE